MNDKFDKIRILKNSPDFIDIKSLEDFALQNVHATHDISIEEGDLNPLEKAVKYGLIGFLILVVMVFFYFALFSEKRIHRQKSTRVFKTGDKISDQRNLTLSDIDKLVSNEADGYPVAFTPPAVKKGDPVGYQLDRDQKGEEELSKLEHKAYKTPFYDHSDGFENAYGGNTNVPKLFIPKNSFARVYMDSPVDGGTNIVTAVSYVDLVRGESILVPKGSTFVGSIGSVRDSRRAELQFRSVVFPDGREYAVRALAYGEDGYAGLAVNIDHSFARRGSGIVASSLLDASSQALRFSGRGFGSQFAGNLAGETSGMIGDTVDTMSGGQKLAFFIPINTKFRVVFL